MSKYLRSTVYKTTFDDDEVTFKLAPIHQSDAIRAASLREYAKSDATNEQLLKANQELNQGLMLIFVDILPKYIESMEGLVSADGSPVTVKELVTAFYFAPLVNEVGWQLLSVGRIKDPKASASPPAGS